MMLDCSENHTPNWKIRMHVKGDIDRVPMRYKTVKVHWTITFSGAGISHNNSKSVGTSFWVEQESPWISVLMAPI